MKKKLLALPLAGATIFALAACGSPSSNDPGTSQEPSSNNSSAPNESQEPERVESTTVDLHDKSNIDNTIKRDSLTVGWNAPTSIVLWGTANNVAGNCECCSKPPLMANSSLCRPTRAGASSAATTMRRAPACTSSSPTPPAPAWSSREMMTVGRRRHSAVRSPRPTWAAATRRSSSWTMSGRAGCPCATPPGATPPRICSNGGSTRWTTPAPWAFPNTTPYKRGMNMWRYVVKRLLWLIVIMVCVAVIIFPSFFHAR